MAARRRRRKKRNGSFVLSLLTFLIVIGAIVASVTVFLKVAEVQVSGSVRDPAADIVESCARLEFFFLGAQVNDGPVSFSNRAMAPSMMTCMSENRSAVTSR